MVMDLTDGKIGEEKMTDIIHYRYK